MAGDKGKKSGRFKTLGVYNETYQLIDLIANMYDFGKAELVGEIFRILSDDPQYRLVIRKAIKNLRCIQLKKLKRLEKLDDKWYSAKKVIIASLKGHRGRRIISKKNKKRKKNKNASD